MEAGKDSEPDREYVFGILRDPWVYPKRHKPRRIANEYRRQSYGRLEQKRLPAPERSPDYRQCKQQNRTERGDNKARPLIGSVQAKQPAEKPPANDPAIPTAA